MRTIAPTRGFSDRSVALHPASAFTLLEMLGVLAILTTLAALTAPAVLRQIDQSRLAREAADLATYAEALKRSVLKTRTVPARADMPNAIAAEASMPATAVAVSPWGLARAFLVDPAAAIGAGLPYTQSGHAGLTAPPSQLRVLMLSSLSRAHPLTAAETASTSANFNAIWAAAEQAVPSTWTAWSGEPDDLRVQRVNLAPLFRRLILVNHDPDQNPNFSIDAAPGLQSVPTVWERHYVDGTVFGLYQGTNLQTRQVLSEDVSFVFELGAWRGSIGPGAIAAGFPESFALSARQFLNAPVNPTALKGASPPPIMNALGSFMLNYSMWANQCPHFGYHGNPPASPTSVPEFEMLNAFGRNNGFIDQYTGSGGLLK